MGLSRVNRFRLLSNPDPSPLHFRVFRSLPAPDPLPGASSPGPGIPWSPPGPQLTHGAARGRYYGMEGLLRANPSDNRRRQRLSPAHWLLLEEGCVGTIEFSTG